MYMYMSVIYIALFWFSFLSAINFTHSFCAFYDASYIIKNKTALDTWIFKPVLVVSELVTKC